MYKDDIHLGTCDETDDPNGKGSILIKGQEFGNTEKDDGIFLNWGFDALIGLAYPSLAVEKD